MMVDSFSSPSSFFLMCVLKPNISLSKSVPGAILQEVKINSSLYALCNVLQLLLHDYGKGMAAVGMGVSSAETDWGWGSRG